MAITVPLHLDLGLPALMELISVIGNEFSILRNTMLLVHFIQNESKTADGSEEPSEDPAEDQAEDIGFHELESIDDTASTKDHSWTLQTVAGTDITTAFRASAVVNLHEDAAQTFQALRG